MLLGLFLILSPFILCEAVGGFWSIDPHMKITSGKDTTTVAWAYYSQDVNTTGWATLSITTNDKFPNELQARAAGYLEGYLTSDLIYMSWLPSLQTMVPGGKLNNQVLSYFKQNLEWMETMIVERGPTDKYWNQAGLLLEQIKGITSGHQHASTPDKRLSLLDVIILNSDGDMGTLAQMYYPNENNLNPDITSHCSVIVKLTNDFSELYAGHTTWGSYPTMLRIYKTYNIKFNNVKSKIQSFSSYPAFVSSNDDFYITDQKLVVTETTNDIYNASLLNYVQPKTLLSWIRAVLANRLSDNGKEWTSYFSKYNSGTYNNQWMVVDYKKFTPNKPLQSGLLWILEQIPGYCHSADVTQTLSLGYWPSYNIPYFNDIYQISGYPQKYNEHGNSYSYSLCPRAEIFRRNQSNIYDLKSFQSLLRYNNYKNDPFSHSDPSWSIASRYDLSGQGPFGGIDTKVTSFNLVPDLISFAISGPTCDQQPPFNWNAYPSVLHTDSTSFDLGQPQEFNFPWIKMAPK